MKNVIWIAFIFLFAGCSSSRITSSWKDNASNPKKYDKILVLGIIGEPDRTIREKMEQHLAGDLKDMGYNAVTASQEYGPKTFEGMNETEAINLLSERGIQAVVTIVLLDKEKERYYTPAHIQHSPYARYQSTFWRYYNTMYDRVYAPGYYSTSTKYFWESNFYDLYDWKLLYSVQSQSFSPESTNGMAHEYGQMIVKDMAKNNVIQKQEKELKSF